MIRSQMFCNSNDKRINNSTFFLLSAHWDNEKSVKSSKVTVEPEEITIASGEEEQDITISNLNAPRGQTERKLIITAKATNCTDEANGCKNSVKHTIKRSILIKV